jgi:hypothetical protein
MPRRHRPASPPPGPPDPSPPASISDREMDEAIAAGHATPLGQVIRYIMRYQDTWWVRGNGSWLAAGTELGTLLDSESERLRAQDAAVARRAAIRAAIALTRASTGTPAEHGQRPGP